MGALILTRLVIFFSFTGSVAPALKKEAGSLLLSAVTLSEEAILKNEAGSLLLSAVTFTEEAILKNEAGSFELSSAISSLELLTSL